VLTPACDLTRDGEVKRVLLVGGTLSLVTSKEWSYSGNVIKTPIIVLPGPAGERRMWVRWNAKDIRTLLPGEVATMLAEGGEYRLTLRLRESHALEIQQKVLSLMGRVGLITPMPATFRMEIAANSCDTTGAPRRLALPTVEREGGVCYTGRDAKGKENSRLVLTEPAIDELLEAISKLSEDDVIPQARETLKRLKASTSLAIDLQRGLEVPPSDKSGFGPLKASAFGAGGETVKETVGLIARNPAPANKPELRHSGFVLILTDPQPERPIPQAVTGTNDAGQQRIDLEGAG
jgi:hypothetical protein